MCAENHPRLRMTPQDAMETLINAQGYSLAVSMSLKWRVRPRELEDDGNAIARGASGIGPRGLKERAPVPIYPECSPHRQRTMDTSPAELLDDEILLLSRTGQVLVRGRKEIAWQLLAVRDRSRCFTTLPGPDGQQRRFRLLDVDCEVGVLFFALDSPGAADCADVEANCLTLGCSCVSGRAEFVIAGIEPVAVPDGHAIRTGFPDVLLLYQDRAFARIPAVSDAWLEWEFGPGHMTLRAQLLDVGLNGAGALLFEPGLSFDPGARLKARVMRKGQRPVAVDLEVCFSAPVLLDDGRRALRMGFRFLEKPPATSLWGWSSKNQASPDAEATSSSPFRVRSSPA
jgi:hypothetical protein